MVLGGAASVQIIHFDNGKLRLAYPGPVKHNGAILSFDFNTEENALIIGSNDGTVSAHELLKISGQWREKFRVKHMYDIGSIHFSDNKTVQTSSSEDKNKVCTMGIDNIPIAGPIGCHTYWCTSCFPQPPTEPSVSDQASARSLLRHQYTRQGLN